MQTILTKIRDFLLAPASITKTRLSSNSYSSLDSSMELARPTFVDYIYEFNKAAGLLDKPYNDFLESSFQIEEALEGFGDLPYLADRLAGDLPETIPNPLKARDIARQIIALAEMDSKPTNLPDVVRLDKACDAVVFAVGSMAKLRLTPEQINEALNIVMTANMQKLTMPKDEHGKLMKPDNFEGPEVKLQRLLDQRK